MTERWKNKGKLPRELRTTVRTEGNLCIVTYPSARAMLTTDYLPQDMRDLRTRGIRAARKANADVLKALT